MILIFNADNRTHMTNITKRYRRKNKHYTPLNAPPDPKASYKQILTWTRTRQTFWYVGYQDNDFISYVLQGNDGHQIILNHYLRKPRSYQYSFDNLPGKYTFHEYKSLEAAILDAGFKKPLSPSVYRAKQRQEREKEQAEEKAEIERYRRYWKELKDLSMNGKYTWRYVTATSTSRSFTTVIDEKTVTLDISIDEKTKQPSYRISSPNIRKSLSLGRKEGDAFERFLLSHCTHSAYIKSNVECFTKTANEYYVFKKEQALLQKIELKNKRKALRSELNDILLTSYKMPNGDNRIGIALLAEDNSGELLQTVYNNHLPVSIDNFTANMKWLLNSINPKHDTTPELLKLYKDLLILYVDRYSHSSDGKVVFPEKTIIKFTNKLKGFQNREFLPKDTHIIAEHEPKSHSDATETKEVEKEKKYKRVNAHDFIIRRSVLSCMYRFHSVINVEAVITVVNQNRNFSEVTVPAGYCQHCQKFFILESDYAQISLHGEALCTVIDEKRYQANYRNDSYFSDLSSWPEKSILGKCGYNVNQTTGLSTLERRKILANVIDYEILSKIEIRSHLKKQIALHSRHPIAVNKWESDESFVAAYNKGNYTKYGVTSLRRT